MQIECPMRLKERWLWTCKGKTPVSWDWIIMIILQIHAIQIWSRHTLEACCTSRTSSFIPDNHMRAHPLTRLLATLCTSEIKRPLKSINSGVPLFMLLKGSSRYHNSGLYWYYGLWSFWLAYCSFFQGNPAVIWQYLPWIPSPGSQRCSPEYTLPVSQSACFLLASVTFSMFSRAEGCPIPKGVAPRKQHALPSQCLSLC